MKNAKPKKKTWKEDFLDMCGLKADLEVKLNDVARDRDRAEEELHKARLRITGLENKVELQNRQILEMQEMMGHLCAQVCREKAMFEHCKEDKEMPF